MSVPLNGGQLDMQRRVVLVRARSGDLIGAAAAGMSPAFQ